MVRRHCHEISDKHYYISWHAPRINVISVAGVVNDTPRHCEEAKPTRQSSQRSVKPGKTWIASLRSQ
jgi:hypothetical protein